MKYIEAFYKYTSMNWCGITFFNWWHTNAK